MEDDLTYEELLEQCRIYLEENTVYYSALKEIIEIDWQEYGGDWDEIEEAQEIAKQALDKLDKTPKE